MKNQAEVFESIDKINENLSRLKSEISNSSEKDLGDVQASYFNNLASNINVHIEFMTILITRRVNEPDGIMKNSNKKLSDTELDKFMMDNWYILDF